MLWRCLAHVSRVTWHATPPAIPVLIFSSPPYLCATFVYTSPSITTLGEILTTVVLRAFSQGSLVRSARGFRRACDRDPEIVAVFARLLSSPPSSLSLSHPFHHVVAKGRSHLEVRQGSVTAVARGPRPSHTHSVPGLGGRDGSGHSVVARRQQICVGDAKVRGDAVPA